MNLSRLRALSAATLAAALAACFAPSSAHAQQTYRNLINQRFRAVSNGPQSAIIVDVKDAGDLDAVRAAIRAKIASVRASRSRALGRAARIMPGRRGRRAGEILTYVDTVLLSHNGKLLTPTRDARSRAVPPTHSLTFNVATSGTTGFTGTKAAQVQAASQALAAELLNLLGPSLGSGTVTILNLDDDAANLTAASTIRGATVAVLSADPNNLNIEIHLPNFTSDAGSFQDSFLALAQTMAQCFHLPYYSNDAFEQGMARAAASIITQGLKSRGVAIAQIPVQTIDPVPGFYYTPYYDLQNQPALGNNTFFPLTSAKQNFNTTATMIAPRLQMAGTVWTKCWIENNNFFKAFNSAYYDAITADPNAPNNMTVLRAAVGQAVPNVEGLPIDLWFEQQYILDTSVTPGPKIYAFAAPTAPDQTVGAGAGIGVYYYNTDKTGDETVLNSTLTPTYYDHAYQPLPSIDNTQAQENIGNGAASVAPIFTGLDAQRIAVDMLVSSSQANSARPGGNEYTRLYFPAGEETYAPATKPSDFSGVLIGAQTGDFVVSFNGGGGALVSKTTNDGGIFGIGQGAFGGEDPGSLIPTGFTKATITVTPNNSYPQTVFQRNVFVRKDDTTNGLFGVAPIWILNLGPNAATTTRLSSHTFGAGAQMVALPLQPYAPYVSNLPLIFSQGANTPDPNAQLIAQYRQDSDPATGKYVRYPSLPPYQPGLGFWTNFAGILNAVNFSSAGTATDNKDSITVPLQFGWNMIGNPYSSDLTFDPTSTANGGIFVQYQNGDVVTLQDAITAGYVAKGIFSYSGTSGYQDITAAAISGGTAPNLLQAWTGYWIRVTVTEGVTLGYLNPTPDTTRGVRGSGANSLRSRAARKTTPRPQEVGGWRMPLVVRDTQGSASGAVLGQSPQGGDNFVPGLDASSPPPFSGRASLGVRFPHPEWDATKSASDGNAYLSDIRHTGSAARWDINVNTPAAEQPYILTWNSGAQLPRGMRLTLVDMATGTRQSMNQATSYTFTPSRGVTTRRFQVVAEPRMAGRLLISNAHADARLSRGTAAAATIFYEVSGASDTTIEVRAASGRVIRHIAQGRAASAGVNQALWDYKDDTGRGLATGIYMIHITARTAEGEIARSIITHPITR